MENDRFVIDASVLVVRAVSIEAAYADCQSLIDAFVDREALIVLPAIALPEVAAALSRGTGDPRLAMTAVTELCLIPGLEIVAVEDSLANLAAKIAAVHRIRGCDAVYVALAQALDATLITLDRQQRERAPIVISTYTPGAYLLNLDL